MDVETDPVLMYGCIIEDEINEIYSRLPLKIQDDTITDPYRRLEQISRYISTEIDSNLVFTESSDLFNI